MSNLAKRRHQRQPNPGQASISQQQLSIDYGHNGQVVVMQFTQKIENMLLSEAQVDSMIDGLNTAKSALIAHKAAAAREGGPGHG